MMPIARVLSADCPWANDDQLPGDGRGASKHYTTMTTKGLCNLRIPPTEHDALLFLWRLSSMPDDALRVCRAWGFRPHSELVWEKLSKGTNRRRVKVAITIPAGITEEQALFRVLGKVCKRHFGMGRVVRGSHETCLIGVKGQASKVVESMSERSSFFAPVGAHSAKPDVFYSIVERIAGGRGPFVELFGRKPRKGWIVYGDEIGNPLHQHTMEAAQ